MSILVVISAPSGSGKTTIAHEILRRHPEIVFSVSATTRKQRPGEIEGKDYYFLTVEEFKKKIDENAFIEWEQLFDNYYGTLKSEVDRAFSRGKSLLFDVDVKGAISIKKLYPREALLIFVKAPDTETVQKRLLNRKTESEDAIRRRLERVKMEMSKEPEFEYSVVNDNVDTAIDSVDAIICKKLTRTTAA
jgi:guanylate kinase